MERQRLRSKQRSTVANAQPEKILPDNASDSEGESRDPTCHICTKPCPKEHIFLFSPPRDSTTHARWNVACGTLLKKTTRICERHFREEDFHRTGKRKRLNKNAIPSLFLYGNEVEEENDAFLFQNVESIEEEFIDIKPDECDEEYVNFTDYFVDTSCNRNYVSRGVQTSLFDDTQTCAFIQLKAEQKIYSVHCFYCDEIFAIWDWTKFVRHINEQHSNTTDQKSVLSAQPTKSSKKPPISSKEGAGGRKIPARSSVIPVASSEIIAGSSKRLPVKLRRKRSPTFGERLALIKAKPDFFEINAMAEELDQASSPSADLNEHDFEVEEEEQVEEAPAVTIIPVESSEIVAGSSKRLRRNRSPTFGERLALIKAKPDFFEINAIAEELDQASSPSADLNEHDFEVEEEEKTEEEEEVPAVTIKKKKCIKDAAAVCDEYSVDAASSTDDDSDDGSCDSVSEFDEGEEKCGTTSRKKPLSCEQIYFGTHEHQVIMDFLEFWKAFPILWHQSPFPRDMVYAAAVTKLTKQINTSRNLTITDAGMVLTLRRIRKWFRDHSANEENSSIEGKFFKRDYYDKCSEFLSKQETGTVSCEKCNHLFRNEEQLKEHNVKRHKQYCEMCQKDFGTTAKYRKHAYIHGPAKFKCEICGKQYFRDAIFQEHMRAHRNERNYICEKCGKKFVRPKNLRNHRILQHPDKDNHLKRQPCAICGIDFKDYIALSNHRRRYHLVLEGKIEDLERGVLPHNGSYSYLDRLFRRRRIHKWIEDSETKERRVVCEVCGNNYAQSNGLLRHQVKEHGYLRPSQRIENIVKDNERKSCDAVSDAEESLRND